MGRESSVFPNYEILAVVTTEKNRILNGKALCILAKDEEEKKNITLDIAKALKGDVTQLSTGDYLVLRV
ncbi:hypothetical protein L1765_00335 [Microaerobacter geothermalis]|uniref:capping complex subunit for YIEGIA n=1 Tax=Microaerobacter geothermalis TaxID=674972 RepID=UPI001F235773|nr:hypothetical protein [Microaerobacter geothermalis]MCF6092438.1 hypothetical protein [Microaerobacter geothermalis]